MEGEGGADMNLTWSVMSFAATARVSMDRYVHRANMDVLPVGLLKSSSVGRSETA